MNEEPEFVEGEIDAEAFAALHDHDLMKLFDELTFRQKWKRVFSGIKQPEGSGEYKWARLQITRLLSPVMAVVVPLLMVGLLTVFSGMGEETVRSVQAKVIDPEPMEKLEEIEEPEFVPPEPPDPIDIQVDFAVNAPSMPTDVAAPPAEAASVQPAEFDSVAMVKSPVVMRGMLGSRTPGAQGAALGRFGGGHTAESVLRSLRWLAKTQGKDGSWGSTKPAMTSLAILAYLAHGDTPASEEFGTTMEAALRYLLGAQEANGRFRGRDGSDYTQPIAAYALAEAAGMTRVPKIREAAIKAVDAVVKGQNPSGGFNYGLVPSERDDTSYMAWCVQALKAAKIAGLAGEVPGLEDCMKKAVLGFRKNYGERDGIGGFGYTGPSNTGLSGAGALCMQFLGEAKSKEVRNTLAGLNRWPFDWEKAHIYYWYYITQAYFQEGGKMWDDWNNQFSHALIKVQEVIGKDASGYVDHKQQPQEIGSWESKGGAGHTGGNARVMDTILCTLMLEVYYRYLPTFQQVPDEEIKKELGDENDLKIEIVERETVPTA
jgi:hypothetical protein